MNIETEHNGKIYTMDSTEAKKRFPKMKEYIELLEGICRGTNNKTVSI